MKKFFLLAVLSSMMHTSIYCDANDGLIGGLVGVVLGAGGVFAGRFIYQRWQQAKLEKKIHELASTYGTREKYTGLTETIIQKDHEFIAEIDPRTLSTPAQQKLSKLKPVLGELVHANDQEYQTTKVRAFLNESYKVYTKEFAALNENKHKPPFAFNSRISESALHTWALEKCGGVSEKPLNAYHVMVTRMHKELEQINTSMLPDELVQEVSQIQSLFKTLHEAANIHLHAAIQKEELEHQQKIFEQRRRKSELAKVEQQQASAEAALIYIETVSSAAKRQTDECNKIMNELKLMLDGNATNQKKLLESLERDYAQVNGTIQTLKNAQTELSAKEMNSINYIVQQLSILQNQINQVHANIAGIQVQHQPQYIPQQPEASAPLIGT